jgi:hypothetical protein
LTVMPRLPTSLANPCVKILTAPFVAANPYGLRPFRCLLSKRLASINVRIASSRLCTSFRKASAVGDDGTPRAEKDGDLPPEKVQALIAGLPTSFENPRHQVVYAITSALIAPRVVPTGLYRRAVNLLGDTGLTDLTVLIGYFTCISLTLMAYDVPASAIGLER